MTKTQILALYYDLGDIFLTLGQGHGTPLHHGQQFCEMPSQFNLPVKSYWPRQ